VGVAAGTIVGVGVKVVAGGGAVVSVAVGTWVAVTVGSGAAAGDVVAGVAVELPVPSVVGPVTDAPAAGAPSRA
jgi:hypothetical protein